MQCEIFDKFITAMNNDRIYILIGNGSKNQFREFDVVCRALDEDLKYVPKDSSFLYFGDAPNPEKPDIGLLFEYLASVRKDIKIFMIQIDAAQKYGVPDFVSFVHFHKEWSDDHKWGGVDFDGNPQSNTGRWVAVHETLLSRKNGPKGISKVFMFGGGQITLEEYNLANKLGIPVRYLPVERKFKGDGKTLVTDDDTRDERIGITSDCPYIGYCFE